MVTMSKIGIVSMFGAVAFALSVSGAAAATMDTMSCTSDSGDPFGNGDLEFSSACIGILEIEKTGQAQLVDVNKLDGGGWMSAGDAGVLPNLSFGKYELTDPMEDYDYAITFKAAAEQGMQFFAGYLLTAGTIAQQVDEETGILTGTFNTNAFAGLNGNSNTPPQLSNFQIWKRDGDGGGGGFCQDGDPTCVPPIPLPAGLPLILAGMGALGILRMCKKRS